MPVGSELKRLKKDHPALEIEIIDVILHPLSAWRDGIRIAPAIKAGDDILSGVILTAGQVRKFVEEHLTLGP